MPPFVTAASSPPDARARGESGSRRWPLFFLLVAVGLGGGVWAGLHWAEARRLQSGISAQGARYDEIRRRIAALEQTEQTELAQAAEIEKDNARLAEALERAQTARFAGSAKLPRPSRKEIDARYRRAFGAIKTGDPATLLQELRWCMDAYRVAGGPGAQVPVDLVLTAIGKLAERSPDALAFLKAHEAELRKAVLAGPDGVDAIRELSATAKAAGDAPDLLALFDQIPADDPRHRSLAITAFDDLVAAHRYAEAADNRPYSVMSALLEHGLSGGPDRDFTVNYTATNIEVLAGAGDLTHAQNLIDRLLKFDHADATVTMLQERVTRAGHPKLAAKIGKP